MIELKGKRALITGASSGIGKAIGVALAQEGCEVFLCARRIDKLEEVVLQIQENGGHAHPFVLDVTDEAACERVLATISEKYGALDILVNNAGISMRAKIEDVEIHTLKKVMDVNFWGAVYCTKYALPGLLAQKGTVLNISSIAGYRGLPGRSGYSASKFAMQGFFESLLTEHLDDGLKVLLLCPGFTSSEIRAKALDKAGSSFNTSNLEEKNLMSTEQVADIAIKMIKKSTKRKVLTRQGKLTVWLNKLLPSVTDRLVLNHFKKNIDNG